MTASTRIVLALAFTLWVTQEARTSAPEQNDPYSATVVTNGFGQTNRERAFVAAFEEVLVKVSGEPRLAADPRVKEVALKAADFVAGFRYRDFLNGRPPNHEQGTYDRPQYLTAEFDHAKVDAVLATLGEKPWPMPRPKTTAFIQVRPMKGPWFMLAREGGNEQANDMRSSLLAVAQRTGVDLILPPSDEANAFQREMADAATFGMLAKGLGGDVALIGKLSWGGDTPGWIGGWELVGDNLDVNWEVRRVGFDDAFRSAAGGIAQVLSGNGNPQPVTVAP